MSSPSPDGCLRFTGPTPSFLCPLSANTYGIDFLAFKIRDMDSRSVVFEISKDVNASAPDYPEDFDYDQLRTISYKFPAAFLRFRTVGTTLRFKVGPREVKDFRMIERHYFKNRLLKSYDFNFDFCIPNSTNEWEAIYDMPKLAPTEIAEMLAAGAEDCQSDSFYFVEGKLIMHNKAKYQYVEGATVATGGAGAPTSSSSSGVTPSSTTTTSSSTPASSSSSGSSSSGSSGSGGATTPAESKGAPK